MRITLVVPVSPSHVGTGLALRASNWERFASLVGEVRTVVVPVAGPSRPDEVTLLPGPDSDESLPRLARGLTRAHGRANAHLAAESGVIVALRSYLGEVAMGMGEALGVPVIVDLDDDDGSFFEQRDDPAEAGRFRSLVARLRNDAIAICSADGFDGTIAVPNSVDFSTEVDRTKTVPGRAIMVANFSYEPNAEGADWFISRVTPIVKESVPDFTLVLVGPGGKRIDPTAPGLVADLAPVYAEASVAVVPILDGAGTRTKIIEAWAHKVPVVSTSVGVAGLDAVHGRNILVADTPEEFAVQVVTALTDRALSAGIADSAWAHGRDRFSWPVVQSVVESVIRDVGDPGRWVFDANPDVEITETEDGLVAFEPTTDVVHNLNRSAAVVFMLADGTRDRAAICREVAELFGLDLLPVKEVDDAIDNLLRVRLLRASLGS